MKTDRFTYNNSTIFTPPIVCKSLYNQIVGYNNITESHILALPLAYRQASV